MANHVAIVHCNNDDITKDIFEFLIQKGYSVLQSTVEIETGTHGRHVVKKLDILSSGSTKFSYNFSRFDNIMLFNTKILKHIETKDCNKLKDYICSAFDSFDPADSINHPCSEVLNNAYVIMNNNGWSIHVRNLENIGLQIVLIDPEGNYFHSNFIRNR